MKPRVYRLGSATLLVSVLTLIIAGCGGDSAPQMDLKNPESIRATVIDCASAQKAKGMLEDASPGALREYGIDPDDQVAIESSVVAVEGQILALCTEGAEESPSATTSSAEPEVSASSSSSSTTDDLTTPAVVVASSTATVGTTLPTAPSSSTRSPAATLDPLKVRTWGELLKFAPELTKQIDANAQKIGWSADSVEQWSEHRVDDKFIDSRLVITTDKDPDIEAARREAGVEDSNVHVISVNGCMLVDNGNVCPEGATVAYTPLVESDGKMKLDPGTGVIFIDDEPHLVTYQWVVV